ncbi:hypothetical protein FS837_010890 [Tulasnella sp. UAMH 9824]|nr:hypothetical protein FS837_010890 [Tulasnella sp. UAMH 9824]
MVTTRGRLAAQSDPPRESRNQYSSERLKEKQEGKARRTNKPKFDDGHSTSTSSSSREKRKTEDKGGLVKTLGKGARGELRNIMNLPIELFAEVCSYLGPFDLRQLALTNRGMWNFLMNKQAKRIWRTALSSVADLPQCPTDLNEPQYVCLMYSSECYTPELWNDDLRLQRRAATLVEPKLIGSTECVSAGGASMLILSYVYHYGQSRSRYYSGGKHFYVDAVNTVVEKYKAIDGRNNGQRLVEYTKELAEQSKDRALTGAGMLKWHQHEMDLQAEQATALWQNIKPKLEPLLQEQRDQRLEQERITRRWKRGRAVSILYQQTARDTLSLKSDQWNASHIPNEGSITALPRVQEMLEADTETITKEQWLEVEDEVRILIRRHWRIVLQKVLSVVETGNAPPAGIPVNLNDDDDDHELVEDIAAIRAKLALVTASFVCTSRATGEIHWFPDVSGLPPAYLPLNADRKKLVTRMLGDLGLDPQSATEQDVKGLNNLICTRCDPNIAKYSTFSRIASRALF